MKSYFLFGIPDVEAAASAPDRALPGQRHPWTLVDPTGDAIAYFNPLPRNVDYEGPEDPAGPGPMVQADISGRHYNEDAAVIEVLRLLQRDCGGTLMDDWDRII